MKLQSTELAETRKMVLDMGLEVRERKLLLAGIPENDGEDLLQVIINNLNTPISTILKQHTPDPKMQASRPRLRCLTLADLDNAYRTGSPSFKTQRKNPRNVIVVFSFSHIRQMILAIKPLISTLNNKIFIGEDLAPEAKAFRSEENSSWCQATWP